MLGIMAGMQMQMLARTYLVYDLTGSVSILGIVTAGNALPMLTLSLFGGAIADRFDRKRIIQIGQFIFAALALVVGVAIYLDYVTWYHLLIAAIVQGATFLFMMPARQSIIPQLVSPEKLTNAMPLSSAAMSAMNLAAPALPGVRGCDPGCAAQVTHYLDVHVFVELFLGDLREGRDCALSTRLRRAVDEDIDAAKQVISFGDQVTDAIVRPRIGHHSHHFRAGFTR